jgi:hypothetical protein
MAQVAQGKQLALRFPLGGVVRRAGYTDAGTRKEVYTTPWSVNVRAEDALTNRLRGGSWTPISAGARPSETIYRDRKLTFGANIISASRMGAHADFSFSSDISDSMRATAFQLAEGGETGGTVVGLVPSRDAFLLAATASELWSMHGDPTTGKLQNVSRNVGMVNANAWCKAGDAGYFLSSRGLHVVGADGSELKSLSEDVAPEELTGVTDAGCTLTYNHADRGVYIHLPSAAVSWFYDVARGAFWPFKANNSNSHVLLGPVMLAGHNDFGSVQSLRGIIAVGSANVTWAIVTGDSAEAAAANGKAAITAALAGGSYSAYVKDSGTLAAGPSLFFRPRVRGMWACVWLHSTGQWAYESVILELIPAGRWR